MKQKNYAGYRFLILLLPIEYLLSPVKLCLSYRKRFFSHIFHSNSETDSNVRNNPCYLICLRHFIRSTAVTNPFFSPPKWPIFLCARIISTMSLTLTKLLYFFAIRKGSDPNPAKAGPLRKKLSLKLEKKI